jgi:arylsulfatase A-like enzyme
MFGKFRALAVAAGFLAAFGCRGPGPARTGTGRTGPASGPRTLNADVPLHLEDHLDAARVVISETSREIIFGTSWAGTCSRTWGGTTRRALFSHVPGRIEYRVKIPAKGRLDFGVGLLRVDPGVKFRVSAREGTAGPEPLFEASGDGGTSGAPHSLNLSRLAGRTVALSLETECVRPGNVAFWTVPTLSGERQTGRPNIILYIIDGAAADFMSVYGYERRTTPCLERLAAEGAVFENAYSNSARTKVSVPSFMTSLHGSVMGGSRTGPDPLPDQAVTMAERLHKAGYVTEVLTSNPYCGRAGGLDRGVDIMRDSATREEPPSSADLLKEFRRLREDYPGEPYWVHFQPTDVHRPWGPRVPLAGPFAGIEDRREFDEMMAKVKWDPAASYEENIEKSGLDLARFFKTARRLYEASLAFQDRTIGRLVEGLKERREWDHTLLIIAADHAHVSAGLPLFDPLCPPWEPPLLASHQSRIPLIFVWPGKIRPGLRLSQPVSMIDMLPTVLDLAGLPRPEVAQGQSLAPLLLGKRGWRPRPIVFDDFNFDGGRLFGSIEVIDGRWGASLRIDTRPDNMKSPRDRLRPAPLLIFDIGADPHAFRSLHEGRPGLAEKYSKILGRLWNEHLKLARKFSRPGSVPLAPDQIETLRSLGYLR